MRQCDDALNQDYVLGVLEPEAMVRLEAHVSGCAACASRVRHYRLLFHALDELPLPPVPEGIAAGVLASLRLSPATRGTRRAFEFLLRRPALAAAVGGSLGLVIAIFHQTLILWFGRMTGGIVTDGATRLVMGFRDILHALSVLIVIVRPVVGAVLKLEPVVRALEEAVRAMPAQASVSSILLSLATAILFARLLGQDRREKLGHARL